MKLYELGETLQNVSALIEEGAEGLEEALDSIEWTFGEKVEGILKLRQQELTEAEAIEKEIARLTARAATKKKAAERMHSYIEREMLKANLPEVKSNLFSIKIGKNPPRVEVINAAVIPHYYVRTKTSTEPDKVEIKAALQRGEEVPGCELRQDLKLKVR